jgi:glutamate-1-semialdehyde 2,1-aminomutase/spore coat polysaccharide biosynthesis protein SpsF
MKVDKSLELYHAAIEVIPSATQTFSKGPQLYPFGVSPIFLERERGSHVWDVDGNEFIDYPMALGAVLLGHAYPAVDEAIQRQLKSGINYTLPHRLESELAALLTDVIPCAQMVRFGKNGSDATAGAIRAARAFTGREKVTCCGYHGWQDWYIGTTTRNKGVPQATAALTIPFDYNDIESLEKIFTGNKNQIAAVIMEPVGVIEPKVDFLNNVKEIARKNGALFIFDEMVTGFRWSLGGAQEYYGVIPDLACFGKAMGSGMPISAVVGRKDIMGVFNEAFFSFTHGGECLSLAAALATVKEIKNKDVINKIWRLGQRLKDGYNRIVDAFQLRNVTECVGCAPHTVSIFKDGPGVDSQELKTLFQQEVLQRGILTLCVHNVSYSHSDTDIEKTLEAFEAALAVVKEAISSGDIRPYLKGEVIQPVFRKP